MLTFLKTVDISTFYIITLRYMTIRFYVLLSTSAHVMMVMSFAFSKCVCLCVYMEWTQTRTLV